jgi:hypothetical protein
MTKDEALKLALTKLLIYQEIVDGEWGSCRSNEQIEVDGETNPAITAIKEALAQPAQEPLNLLEARRIADEYKTPDSQVDSGNLYFALMKCLEFIEAQPAQKPFGYLSISDTPIFQKEMPEIGQWETLYITTPQQRTWVGLTDGNYFGLQMKIKNP